MRAKKADSSGLQLIIVLIVAIAFAMIYFVWLKDFRIFGENLTDYTICKNSNIENAKLKLKIDNQVIAERKGNKCKTEYIEVPKGEELATIAKKMAGCWDMYLEGKEELFDTEDNNYCAICSVLTFEDKKKLTGLTTYLTEKKVPAKGIKYYDYLTRSTPTEREMQEIRKSELNTLHTIDTEKPMAIIFVMEKDVNPGSLTGQSSIVTAAEGTAFGAVAGLATLLGFGLCSTGVGCSLGAFLVAAGAGTTGYLIGSDEDPKIIKPRVLLWSYANQDLQQLKCTILEGQDRLDIRK